MQPGQGHVSPPQQSLGLSRDGTVALVLSVLTMVTGCFPLGFVALYYGRKVRRRGIESGHKSDETMGLVAMIVGGISGVSYALVWIGVVVNVILVFWQMNVLPPPREVLFKAAGPASSANITIQIDGKNRKLGQVALPFEHREQISFRNGVRLGVVTRVGQSADCEIWIDGELKDHDPKSMVNWCAYYLP